MEKILIIEDDDLIRENLTELFKYENYIVYSAENGRLGILKALEIIPDIIISDIMMPELNGFEVYDKLRQDNRLVFVPFIFLSALNDKENIRQGMNLGADDFITKPFLNSELLNVVKNRLTRSGKIKKSIESLKESIALSIPHEFRTPLNGIIGFSQLLIETCNEELILDKKEVLDYSISIYESGQRLLRIIKNYSLYTELILISSNKNIQDELKKEIILEPNKLIREESFSYIKKFSRENDFVLELQKVETPIKFKKDFFIKVLQEILDNSIKFSKQDSKIILNISTDSKYFYIELLDLGIGMNQTQINEIESFIQFDRSMKEQQGLGLGLFIVKKILEIYNGSFKIENRSEGGFKLLISFPLV